MKVMYFLKVVFHLLLHQYLINIISYPCAILYHHHHHHHLTLLHQYLRNNDLLFCHTATKHHKHHSSTAQTPPHLASTSPQHHNIEWGKEGKLKLILIAYIKERLGCVREGKLEYYTTTTTALTPSPTGQTHGSSWGW